MRSKGDVSSGEVIQEQLKSLSGTAFKFFISSLMKWTMIECLALSERHLDTAFREKIAVEGTIKIRKGTLSFHLIKLGMKSMSVPNI
jgi:hypothetical protein